MIIKELIKQKKTMYTKGSVNVYDHQFKSVTSSGAELITVLQDMGGYLPVAAPSLISCVIPDLSDSSYSSGYTCQLSTGSNGPIVGVVIKMALGSTDTPRLLDFDLTGQNNTRGTGYSINMTHLKADFIPPMPELTVLLATLNGKNTNVYACADTLSINFHPTSGLRENDIVKVELLNVGHPYFEEYLASIINF